MISDALSKHDTTAIRHYRRAQRRADLSSIPGDNGWPWLGHVPQFLTNVHKLMRHQYQHYGSISRFRSVLMNGVFLLGPEANALLLKNENRLFSNYMAWDPTFARLFDNNLLERDFNSHKIHRRILQQAFKRPSIEGHIAMMNPMLAEGVAHLVTGKTIKMMPFIKRLLLNVGAGVFLGENIGQHTDKLNTAFVDMVAATVDPFKRNIPFTPYAKGIKARQVLSDFVLHNIEKKRAVVQRDLFSQICHLSDEDGTQFTDEEIRDHIIFVLFAAHDTTTSALCSVLFSLASHPDWQAIVAQEMQNINKTMLNHDDLDSMVQTGLVIKEALRMYPPLSLIPRYCLRAFEYGDYRVPANTLVVISPLFTHYMEAFWHHPQQFDPDRFSLARGEDKKHFFQYIPFGGGAHKCLGLHFAEVQAKMFLYHFLQRYTLQKKDNAVFQYNNVPLTFPKDGLPLTLCER